MISLFKRDCFVFLFSFELVSDSKEGTVFPPLMTITYSDIPVTDVATQTVSVSQAHIYTLIFIDSLHPFILFLLFIIKYSFDTCYHIC